MAKVSHYKRSPLLTAATAREANDVSNQLKKTSKNHAPQPSDTPHTNTHTEAKPLTHILSDLSARFAPTLSVVTGAAVHRRPPTPVNPPGQRTRPTASDYVSVRPTAGRYVEPWTYYADPTTGLRRCCRRRRLLSHIFAVLSGAFPPSDRRRRRRGREGAGDPLLKSPRRLVPRFPGADASGMRSTLSHPSTKWTGPVM